MNPIQLRPYQIDAVNAVRRSVARGHRAPLLTIPTGGGKTLCIMEIIRGAEKKGRSSLLICPRRELVYQASEKLGGIDHGLIMSGEQPSIMPNVQVASIQTLARRINRLPKADLLIIDEAHATFSGQMREILAHYPDAIRIGMTATPARSDGRGLGELYDDLIIGPSVSELTKAGYLVPMRYFAPSEVDLDGVRTTAGDYNQKDLSGRMNTPTLIGGVVENWIRIAADRITVVFAVDRKHAMALCLSFRSAGVASEYIDGETPSDERHATFARMESGETRVLCSVAVIDMGWDQPCASCAILARPTKSIGRYLQMAGRVLRPYPAKSDSCLIDHTGTVRRLGYVDDIQPWSLDGKEKLQERKERQKKDPQPITCPACKSEFRPQASCPECGHDMSYQSARAIREHEARLREITKGKPAPVDKAAFYAQLKGYAGKYKKSHKWVLANFHEKFGEWPYRKDVPAAEPTSLVYNYVKARQIAWQWNKLKRKRA